MQRTPRCSAIHPTTHVQCGLPAGHEKSYRHQNGTLTPSWDDAEATVSFYVAATQVFASRPLLVPEQPQIRGEQ